jgi:hypothetical protein
VADEDSDGSGPRKVVIVSPENKIRLELLRSAPLNKWIALSEDESSIVAVGETYGEVSERSDLAGEVDPVILKTPQEWAPLSV